MIVLRKWCVTMMCCWGLALPAWAFDFADPVDVSAGSVSGVTSLQMADISGDGRADIVCAEGGKGAQGRYTFAWFEAPQTAGGTWTRHNIATTTNLRPFLGGMRLRDMDKDGHVDIVLSSDMHSGNQRKAEVFIFYHPGGNGTGNWNQVKLHADKLALHHLNDMEVGDFDRDGRLDVAVRSLTPNQIHLFFQNQDGSWFLRSLDTGIANSEGMGIGDLDGDGGEDITFTGYWFDFPNNPRTGTITKRTIDGAFKNTNQNTKEFTADIDGDGDVDLVMGPAEKFRSGANHKLNWYENLNGDASTWKTHTIESNTNNMHTIIGGDMDNDGDIDIITGQPWGTVQVRIFENDGKGNFSPPQLIVNNKGLYTGAIGDVDKDGDLDLAGQNGYAGSSRPYVYVNNTDGEVPPPVPNERPTAAFSMSPSSGVAPVNVDFDSSGSSDSDGTIVSRSWDFGDGSTGTGTKPSHTFTQPGSYAVKLTVTDDDGATRSRTKTVTVTAPPTPNDAPTAVIAADTTEGDVSLTVNFDGTGSTDPDPDDSIVSYYWDFGDGDMSVEDTPTHTFTTPGTYTVTLTVTDAYGDEDSDTIQITVNDAPAPPTGDSTKVDDTDARVVWSGSWGIDKNNKYTVGAYNNTLHWAKSVGAKGSLTFNGDWIRVYCKTAGNGKILRVSVDGAPFTDVNLAGSGEQQQMIFEQKNLGAGEHTIIVEARGKTVHVDYFEFGGEADPAPTPNEKPVAAIAADTFSAEAPAVINFDGTASLDSDGSIVSYAWDFGDGASSTQATPSHTYAAAGDYSVELMVTDDDGATDVTTETVSITSAPEPPPTGNVVVDDTDASIQWNGTWGIDKEDKWTVGAYNETLHWSSSKGATGTLTFTGTWIRVYCKTASNGGILRVSVDGGTAVDIDLNGNGEQQQKVFEKLNLSAGSHTITVENRSRATHVDFFEYGN